jgi:small subunit ribosomal protein S9
VSAGEGQKDIVTESPVSEPTVEAEAPVTEAAAETPAAETPAPAPVKAPRSLPRTERPIQTVGRRKEAIVRVRILAGSGKFTLNGRTLEAYFPSKVHQQVVREPLTVAERLETVDVIANLRGGGVTGQAGALRLAIARALIELDADDRPVLKKAGFLTRDSREKESKKYGLKKARKAPQYSKR